MMICDLTKGHERPIPNKGSRACYRAPNGWVAKELRDLHPLVATAIDTTWNDSSPRSRYDASRRFYCAAVLSVVFNALDQGVAPSLRLLADLLNAEEVPKPTGDCPWDNPSLRKLLVRYGLYDNFLSYRTEANPAFVQWAEETGNHLTWCRTGRGVDL